MMHWTIANHAGGTVTIDGRDLDEDALHHFLCVDPESDEEQAAAAALASYLETPRGETAWAADFFGLSVEEIAEEMTAWERRLRDARTALTRAQAEQITRERDAAAALSETGVYGDSEIVRLAYIWRTLGKRAAEQTVRDADQAEQDAPKTPAYARSAASRRVTVAAFNRAYETAKTRVRERAQAIAEGRLLPGRLFRAIRTSMGLEQTEIASELRVSVDTVRSWEQGRAPVNEGVTSEMWGLWRAWLADAKSRICEGGAVPALGEDEDLSRIRVMLIAADGGTVTLS